MRHRLRGIATLSNKFCFDFKKHFISFNLIWALYCAFLTLLTTVPALAQRQSKDHPDSFTFYWENDAFANTDQNYTNGLRLTWSTRFKSADERIAPNSWLNYLPFTKAPETNLGFALSLGQSIYTPTDTEKRELIQNDRPYAGYLYVGLGLSASRQSHITLLELDVGVIGPLSLAEELQNGTHRLIGQRTLQGWDNQLNNELTIELIYQKKWRICHWQADNGVGVDLIPHLGGRLGNVAIGADAGTEVRFGWHLPDNFGTCPVQDRCDTNYMARDNSGFGRSPSAFGINLFAGIHGYYVLRDIFLDGNTFSSSHSVDKKPFVAEAMAGIACYYKRVRIYYSYIWRSKEFYKQERSEIFGSIGISFDY
jgi:lipid A 3-O-deacylase